MFFTHRNTIAAFGLCLLSFFATAARAQESTQTNTDTRVHILDGAEYGYYAPEIRELYARVPIKVDPVGNQELFAPQNVFVDGTPVEYTFWYFDGATFDYEAMTNVSAKKIEVFIPVAWRAGEKHTIRLQYVYDGKAGEQTVVLPTPPTGGAWKESTGANQAFLIREEAGLTRQSEPVEIDVAAAAMTFTNLENGLRATIMRKPGVFEEIPCQVYEVEHPDPDHHHTRFPSTRFRVAFQLSLPAKSEVLLHLWSCPAKPSAPSDLSLKGGAQGGLVENQFYKIQLDAQSGQMLRWTDKRLKTNFAYEDDRGYPGDSQAVIHRTPDLFRIGIPWSHALEWTNPVSGIISGPLFCETTRGGPMPLVPEVNSRVTYRFFQGRPELRMSSVMHVLKDVPVLAFRNGNMIFSKDQFTDIAWPRQDGSIARLPVAQALGNDMGAPPPARFPADTAWVAFYNRNTHIGMALITVKSAYFSEGAEHPNESRKQGYASFYRNHFLYAIRSFNQTYCAATRSYVVTMHAGTIAYEDMVFLPFAFDSEGKKQFKAVEDLQKELLNPLIVVP